MASGPINSWQIDGEKLEAVTDFLFLDSSIIMDGDCSHERKTNDVSVALGNQVVEGDETVADFIFWGCKITADGDCSHEIKGHLLLGRKVMTNLDSILKSQRHYFANKGLSSQSYGFSSSHVWM